MVRWFAIALLGFLASCDPGRDAEAEALRREVEEQRQENLRLKVRERELREALEEQLEIGAKEKADALEKLEEAEAANAPLIKKVEQAERRVLEMEEMHKEIKKLE